MNTNDASKANDASKTIYLNHAGTSWPKPPAVLEAASRFTSALPSEWPTLFHSAFETVASFFHVDQSRLLLTPSCTAALQLAMMDLDWQAGDRILCSQFEHHALSRNLTKISKLGVEIVTVPAGKTELIDFEIFESELKNGKTKLVAMTAACNVTGQLLPMEQVINLAHQHGAMVLIDGAQVAGWWDIDLQEIGVDMFTFAGHKGTLAPWGIGGLYVAAETVMECCSASCEIVEREEKFAMPGYCDAGSVNLSALLGLAAGCQTLEIERAATNRLSAARELAAMFSEQVRQLDGITIYHDVPTEQKMPSVAIDVAGKTAAEVTSSLRAEGVIPSGGFQCSPDSHRVLGTASRGLTRFSFAPTNSAAEIEVAIEALNRLCD